MPIRQPPPTGRLFSAGAGWLGRTGGIMTASGAPVLVVMGVAGTGKSTIAGLLAGHLGWDLTEGDDLHPPANVAKMSEGIPLTDEDRWPWLVKIAEWIDAQTAAGAPGIVTCSALKRSYRDRLRRPNVIFVYLAGARELIAARMAARMDHFMPTALLDSQFATLEEPGSDESVIKVDLSHGPSEEVAEILRQLGRA
jgi:gluconokinase